MSLTVHSKPLILHLRGPSGDECGLDVSVRAFNPVKETCHSQQRIHLHCFPEDCEIKRMWSDYFPNVYFGFTAMVQNFNSRQIQALREIDLTIFPNKMVRVCTSAYIGEVAALVSAKRGEPVSVILGYSVDIQWTMDGDCTSKAQILASTYDRGVDFKNSDTHFSWGSKILRWME